MEELSFARLEESDQGDGAQYLPAQSPKIAKNEISFDLGASAATAEFCTGSSNARGAWPMTTADMLVRKSYYDSGPRCVSRATKRTARKTRVCISTEILVEWALHKTIFTEGAPE